MNNFYFVATRISTKTFMGLNLIKFKSNVTDNKARYMATKVACGWAGAIFEVTRPFGQEQGGQR